jgi:hypothetical protein
LRPEDRHFDDRTARRNAGARAACIGIDRNARGSIFRPWPWQQGSDIRTLPADYSGAVARSTRSKRHSRLAMA